jgi:hypothetical protein
MCRVFDKIVFICMEKIIRNKCRLFPWFSDFLPVLYRLITISSIFLCIFGSQMSLERWFRADAHVLSYHVPFESPLSLSLSYFIPHYRTSALNITLLHMQCDWKVTQLIPDICSVCQKINYIEIRKQKTMLYDLFETSTAFSDACIHSFPHVWCNWTISVLHACCVTETVHQTRYCRFFWPRRIGKCTSKLIPQIK